MCQHHSRRCAPADNSTEGEPSGTALLKLAEECPVEAQAGVWSFLGQCSGSSVAAAPTPQGSCRDPDGPEHALHQSRAHLRQSALAGAEAILRGQWVDSRRIDPTYILVSDTNVGDNSL